MNYDEDPCLSCGGCSAGCKLKSDWEYKRYKSMEDNVTEVNITKKYKIYSRNDILEVINLIGTTGIFIDSIEDLKNNSYSEDILNRIRINDSTDENNFVNDSDNNGYKFFAVVEK